MTLSEGVDSQTVLLRYRNREITAADLEFLRQQCSASMATRVELARTICGAWDWRQANGSLSTYACADLLLRLEERQLLTLPAPLRLRRRGGRKAFSNLPLPPELIVLTGRELRDADVDLSELCVRPVAAEERLGWRLYMDRYHYLGDRPIVGEHLLYAAFLGGELVALLGWASAAFRAPLREAYVGWGEETKRRRLHFVANNIRFLIPPWIRVRLFRLEGAGAESAAAERGLADCLEAPAVSGRDLRRHQPVSGDLLPSRQLDRAGTDRGSDETRK